jgi:hypothetical protein
MMSQDMASSQPPPKAKPFTAAITATGRASKRLNTRWPKAAKPSAWLGLKPCISAMSAPATKALAPAPVRMSTRAPGREATSSSASSSSRSRSPFRAFRALGRLSVSRATPAPSSNSRRMLVYSRTVIASFAMAQPPYL